MSLFTFSVPSTTPGLTASVSSTTPGLTAPEHDVRARYANVVLGLWLFCSAFLWSHNPSSRNNTWLVGLFVATSAIVAVASTGVRRLTSTLALWLLFTTVLVYPERPLTFWNNLVVAFFIFGMSLLPLAGRGGPARP
jgi:hypothetical protein